jgi:SPP1 family predicted phage head-tail adaptor
MTIRAGLLNRLVRFERRQPATDAYNEPIGTWVEFARAKAEVRALTGREFFAALQSQSESTLLITCRYMPTLSDVRTTDRIVDGTRVYDIRAVQDPDGRRRELRFLVIEHDEAIA